LALGVGAVAVALPPPRGSRAALAVVKRVLAEIRSVPLVVFDQRHDLYFCPSNGPAPTVVAAPKSPATGCSPLSGVIVQRIRGGYLMGSLATNTASGFPTVRYLTDSHYNWVSVGLNGCWHRESRAKPHLFVISYAGERVSVARHHGLIVLTGIARSFGEVDAIDPKRFRVERIVTVEPTKYGVASVINDFSYPRTAPKFPSPTPAC
jgi:hypothetical protein